MWAVVPYLLPLGITVAANLGTRRLGWKRVTFVSLALLNGIVWVGGFLLLGLPLAARLLGIPSPWTEQAAPLVSLVLLGLALCTGAAAGWALLATPVRVFLSRWLPIDPNSPVHATALIFATHLVVASLALLPLVGGLLADADIASLGPGFVVLGQLVFVLFALAGVGTGIRRDLPQTLQRLGLRKPTSPQLLIAVAMILLFLACDYATSKVWQYLMPSNFAAVMQASEQLYAGFSSPLGALLLGVSAGIGEETLFRGALQPRLRIPLTALVFAAGHVQYSLSPAILEILVIGLALGWLRDRTNTTTCMLVHGGYNFLNVLLVPLWA